MFRNVEMKCSTVIVSEWDALATVRFQQITSGEDITYRQILVPSVLALVSDQSIATALDAGCGVGFLTDLLAQQIGKVIGIDPSGECIKIARSHHGKRASFVQGTFESYSEHTASSADLVVANMVLMDVIDLDTFIAAAYRALRPGGTFVFSITHPCFWPSYYGYETEPWFHYSQELVIEGPFKITAQPDCTLSSTHVHRPLEAYIQAFQKAQLLIEVFRELMPSGDIEALYPEPWVNPRYIVGLCRR